MTKFKDKVFLDYFDKWHKPNLIAKWLNKKHVIQWWGDPDKQLKACLARPLTGGHAIIRVNELPVGYIRWQRIAGDELNKAGLDDIPEGSMDIDILIGEEAYLGNGIGPITL